MGLGKGRGKFTLEEVRTKGERQEEQRDLGGVKREKKMRASI